MALQIWCRVPPYLLGSIEEDTPLPALRATVSHLLQKCIWEHVFQRFVFFVFSCKHNLVLGMLNYIEKCLFLSQMMKKHFTNNNKNLFIVP